MEWVGAFRKNFPAHWREMAIRTGDGLRELLASPDDLEEAHHTCLNGLLATHHVTLGALRQAGEKLVRGPVFALELEAGKTER